MDKYNFEAGMAAQEANEGKVEASAVAIAKENIAKKKAEEEAREVERRLQSAERRTAEAERDGRYASKKKNILKKYSEDLNAAKAEFEKTGDYKAYDAKIDEISNEKDRAISEAKKAVYGNDAWRY